ARWTRTSPRSRPFWPSTARALVFRPTTASANATAVCSWGRSIPWPRICRPCAACSAWTEPSQRSGFRIQVFFSRIAGKPLLRFVGLHGPRDVIALRVVAAHGGQQTHRGLVLYAFGGDLHAQAVRQPDDGTDD